MVILVIDNYDSFTFNLVHLLMLSGKDVRVVRNDAVSAEEVVRSEPDAVVLSPGPGTPADAGISAEVVRRIVGRVPVLGVCLGHQVLATLFGARVVRTRRVVHGKTGRVRHDGQGIFRGLPDPLEVMRYHSLVVDRESIPRELQVCAWIEEEPGLVMGLRHVSWPLMGVQFHPESFLTPQGPALVRNFIEVTEAALA